MIRAPRMLAAIMLLVLLAHRVCAQCIVQEITPPPGGPVPNNFASLASAGDVLAVGDSPGMGIPGRVYVYRRINDVWQHEATLHDPDADADTAFYRPATNGEVILVGAPKADGAYPLIGAVHAWRHDGLTWVYEARLDPKGKPEYGYSFGDSLDIEGDVAVVGARFADYGGFNNAGSAFVLRYDRAARTWRHEQQLHAPIPQPNEYFGLAVDVHGDAIIVGAPGTDDGRGVVYIFRHDGSQWMHEAELTAFDATTLDYFGIATHANGDFVAVGASEADQPLGPGMGAAYTFTYEHGRWRSEAKIVPADPTLPSQSFGIPITSTADGSALIVGATSDSFGATFAGASYLYRRIDGQWTQTGKLGDPTPSFSSQFGFSAVVNGDHAIISAINGGSPGGVVFVFDGAHQRDCDQDGIVDACIDVPGPAWPVTPASCEDLADLNGDGLVGALDVALLLLDWGACESGCAADIDGNGAVDGHDLAFLLGFWGRLQPA